MIAASGSALASWTELVAMLAAFAAVVIGLTVAGRAPAGQQGWAARLLLRPPDALQRLTGIPGWAAASIGVGLFGLLVAGQGFYSDVAWHIALGRDDQLFTAPHTSIVVGLVLIFLAGVVAITIASLQRMDTAIRWRGLRVPWSAVPLTLLGASAVMGFPLDEVWHAQYGIDVTMWSPTHMLMILGASLSGMASWLVLAEAGVSPRRSRWSMGVHVLAGWLTLQGLASSQGEFAFGVPQFQQVYLPILVSLAAAFAIVAIRLVIGPFWALGITGVTFLLQGSGMLELSGDSPVTTRPGGLYVVSALAVEVVARVLGTERRLRFAVSSGLAVGTVGLAGEWWWNSDAYQPWRASLLPDAVILATIAGLGAAVLGAAYGSAVAREPHHRLPRVALVLAGLAVLGVIAFPFPRRVGEVRADMTLERVGADRAVVTVTLDPPDAADDARWFQASNWQGGTLLLAEMEEVGPGTYRSEEPVIITGKGKTLVRLHRNDEMMAIPVRLPADPEIGKPEIPAVDRRTEFVSEQRFLMREAHGGGAWLAVLIDTLLVLVVSAWVTAFVLASQRVRPGAGPGRDPRAEPDYALAS